MSERKPNSKIAPYITRPGESLERIGSNRVTELLPDILQTTVNKQFFDSTLEQLMSSGSLEAINHYIGKSFGRQFHADATDNYLYDNRSNDAYQFETAMVNKNEDNSIDQVLAYDDLIKSLKYNEVNTNNHNKVLNETGYTLDLPINYDMFLNYHRYFWVMDVVPVCELKYTSHFDIDTLPGKITYTTPVQKNGRTLTLENGMRIMFAPHTVDRFTQTVPGTTVFTATVTGGHSIDVYLNNVKQIKNTDYTIDKANGIVTFTSAPLLTQEIEIHTHYSHSSGDEHDNQAIYIVDGVGEPQGIKLTKQFEAGQYEGKQGKRTWLNVTVYNNQEPSGFDADTISFDFRPFDLREHRMTTRDYTCEQRYSPDQSAWARSNLWVHEDTISAMLTYQGVTDNIYAIERYRAVRPIIEYKAGIEKYNFGKRHVLNVDHYLESADNPDTTIVGQTSYSVTISGINTEWSGVVGYDRGDKVKVTSGSAPNFVVTYWECVQAHGEIRKPTHGEHREFWEQITPVEVENGDLIIFFGSSNTVYNSKIWRVSGVGTSIALSRAYDFDGSLPGVTKLLTNDKILLLNGFNTFDFGTLGGHGQGNAEAPKSGAELYVDPTTTTGWAYSKQKEHRSQGMCVQLYDTDLTKLDDETKYPTSDFFGATIFDFQHNENNSYDDALGFRPEYVDYGNNPGLNFCVDLLNYRYTYVSQSANFEKSNQIEIAGYYYYKYFVENRYHNGWSIMRDNQPVEKVIKKVVTDQTVPLVVDLGHEKYISDRHYTFFKEHGKLCVYSQKDTTVNQGQVKRLGGKLPTLFFYNDNAYTITTQFPQAEIEFVNIDGTPVGAGITRSAGTGNQFTLTLTTPTVEAIKYRLVADPAQFGVIFFDVKTNETNVRVKKNGITFRNYTHVGNIATISSGLVLDDVYEFSFCTDAEYSATGEGNHKLASTQIFNPQNQDFGKISFGDLIDHMRSQMRNHPLFEGDWYGTNNYRNIVRVHDHIGTIRQQPYSTELLNQLLVDTNTNPYSALQFNSSQYSDFKERFKQKIVQLHNSLDITLPTYVLVDRTLEALNIGKSSTQAFANSQMAMYRDYKSVDVSWVLNQTPVFDLPEEVNDYDDTFNHIQVWIQIPDSNGDHTWKSLVKDIGYTLTANKVTIIDSDANNMPGSGKNNAHIRWYKRGSVSFVPTSDVKLGLNKPFTPELRSDYSKDSTGTATDSVIIGHDGSIHVRNGTELYQRQTVGYDPIDAGLWDLELRIYNNLGSELDGTINLNAYTPNAHRPAVYTWNEVNNTIRSEFNKYKARNNITELNSDTYYDGADKFTWNYSSVGPGIGGYRGLYHYFFNTDRPHTHPWEMLGFNKKPTWWDTYYSWTDAVKRASLLIALEFGKVSDPSTTDVFDINYALKNYDWQNDTLVTLLGTLNDPVTANVVASPVDPAKDFVFGDWGPVEALWRRTSEGKIASALSFLRTRPLIALNKYFRTLRRQIKNVNGYNNPQEIDAIALKLTSWKNTKLTGTSITGKIIESVRILESGSGYTSTPTVKVTDNFGVDGAVEVIVDSGAVVGARVTNQGSDYYNRPDLEISGGAVLDPVLVENASHYFNGLSNNIVEFSNMYGTGADTLRTRLQNLTYQPVIKAGGYVNRNNQFILESSQDKGRVFVPEENVTTLLYTNKPDTEFFYGGIRIAKTVNGYTLNGYDNSLAYFIYNKPNTATDPITVNIDGAESVRVVRYRVYEENTSILDYNTELKTIQDVYDFILGYGHYLNSLGFTQQWRSASASFVNWAISDSTSELNLIPDPNKVIVQDGEDGYFDNIDKRYDGVYNLHGADGNQLQSNQLIIDRKSMEPDAETIFQVKDTDTLLYGIRLYKVQLEHIFVFENITNFDDTISNLTIGQSHDRIIWRGSRTKNWNGKLYSPGYIVDDNTILPNFDTTVKEVDQYLGRTNTLANSQLSDVARFNTGYNKPNWSDNLDLDDDSVFEFVKGSYKYKSTAHALKAFMRNKGLYDGIASAELLEKWAVRMADFGDTRPRETFEFQITPDLLETSPQPVRFNDTVTYDVLSDIVIDINAKSPLVVYDGVGNNFSTRDENTYKNTSDPLFANDLITSGLPLLQEADYRVINKEDFTQFPTEVKDAYNHDGDWQDIENFDTRRSYKFNEKVLHKGRTWTMLDEDGSSGLTTAENPIEIHGNIQLPTIPSGGQTLIVDGNTITLSKTATSTSTNTITVTGTQNIGSTNAVPHGSTVILGQTSALNNTITFSNPVTNVTFNDIEKIGTTSNPSINGSATATLIIDGTTISFNDLVPSTSNITAQLAFENAFNASWVVNQGTIAQTATDRIARIEGLRASYVAANSAAAWTTWITTYFNNAAGINISHLITLIQAGGTTQQAAEFMLDQDLILINNIRQTNYIGTLVVAGSQTVTAVDISATQNALNNGAFIDDVATYLINSANANTTFTTTTNVATTTTNVLQTYTLTDIIQKINNAGISNVTASSDNNRLKITKTTNTPQTQFSLTISVGTQNATVGFGTAQETIQSQGSTTTTTPNLSIQQVVDQINLAGISGITAQRGANNNNLLQINCTLNQLFIGAGTANGDIGLPSGVVPASQVTTTSNIGLNISDIVEQFNAASITGVTASISNNEFKLTSTNSILTIGSGTANSSLGLTAQTFNATRGATANIFSALVDNNGNPVFLEDANDPNIFSIWVADNSEFGNYNLGYQVYQSMNFGMYTNNICVGNQSADEAQIDVVRQTGDVQAHNLQVGDYVLIRGSNSVPSLDGIHQVTRVDSNNTSRFYIDEYIDQEGNAGNIYPLRKVRFGTLTELESSRQMKINNVYKYNFAGVRQTQSNAPIYAFVDDDGTEKSAVYKWEGTWSDANGHVGNWVKVRNHIRQARNDLLDNITLYDAEKQQTLKHLEIYDPAKGIIFGFIDKEIDYKITNDVANYNYNTLDGEVHNINAWGRNYLGKIWWDISTAVYLDYEQSTIDYQQNNWGRLFDGASIDIYEWTASPVLPEAWETEVTRKTIIDGREASGEAYSVTINGETVYNWTEETYYNDKLKKTETVYYFWVKNRTNASPLKTYNSLQMSLILANPGAFNLSWAAQAGNNTLMLANIEPFVKESTVCQLNNSFNTNADAQQDWYMLSENDPNCTIPEYLHIKVRDSLAGFNRFTFDTTFTTWSNATVYAKDAVVKEGANYYISLVANNSNEQPSTDTDMSNWSRIYDYNFIEGTQADDISIWRGQPVPDLKLHKYNRYGHQVRPRQSLYRDLKEARQNFVYSVNSLLSEVNVIDEINNWENAFTSTFVEGTVTYRIKDYVNLVDWNLIERDSNGNITFQFNPNTVADLVYNTKQDYIDAGQPSSDGSYVLIKSTSPGSDIDRAEMYHFVDGTDKLVYKEKATIQLSEEMWNQDKFGHGFDAIGFDVTPFDHCSDNVIGKLMDLLRTEIFIGRHHVKYNQMWFKLLFTSILQNAADDFAFKTTYASLGVKRPLLTNKKQYQEYSIENIEEFVNSTKPFHTKLLSSLESVTFGESTNIEIDEQDRQAVITMKYEDHSTREWACDLVLSGGEFSTVFGASVDFSLFTHTQSNLAFDYNGNVFVQPACEGWGEELVPTDFTENVSIAVQTMLTPTLDSGHTRSFRMMQYQPSDIHSSNVIVDANNTTLFADINATDTTITVGNATTLDDPGNDGAGHVPGVIYIGNERITYEAIDGNNLLFCTRGTLGTSAIAHTNGDIVVNSGASTRIPTVAKFSHYGNGLRLAYNDSGMSLTEHVAVPQTPEHRFIRNAGKGTI